jgi:hypothetical protein
LSKTTPNSAPKTTARFLHHKEWIVDVDVDAAVAMETAVEVVADVVPLQLVPSKKWRLIR